jgi:hypothetical protein
MSQVSPKKKVERLSRLYAVFILSIIGTYGLGALFYADPFNFWELALSELGTTFTLLGTPNHKAAVLVSMGMLFTAGVLFVMANIYRISPGLHYHTKKSLLLYTASAGVLIAILPNNINHFMHSIGSALEIGSIYILTLILIEENNQYIGIIPSVGLTALISLCIVLYSAAFFLDTPAKQPSQKLCLISLLLVLYSCTRYQPRIKDRFNTFMNLNLPKS